MKKHVILLVAVFAGCLLLAGLDKLGTVRTVTAQKKNSVKTTPDPAPNESDRELATVIRRLTEGAGPKKTKSFGGGILTDLQGGLQNVMLSQLDESGEPVAACVSSVEEANEFLGRNLVTGEKVARRTSGKESLSVIAARHGMTEPEFLFYSRLASEAFQQQLMMSPQSATITIVNGDGVNEGFNDPAARAAEGGNAGTTLGQQRMNLFNNAAAIWGAFLDSAVAIRINSQFNPLAPCSPSGGVLGSAGTRFTAANFAGAPSANTDYHIALANKLAGSDLTGGQDLISATFNGDVDAGCLGGGSRFYYGLDNSTPANTVNLLIVLLHEMGHGLGFSNLSSTLTLTGASNASPIVITAANHGIANGDVVTIQGAIGNTAANGTWTVANRTANTFELVGSTGNGGYTPSSGFIRMVRRNGRPGVWDQFMYDRTTGKYWSAMTTAERQASSVNPANVLWDGANVKIASGSLTAGRDAATGRVQLYTPGSFVSGSSVSHWDTAATANLLMEPNINVGLPLTLDLTRQLMRDIGWFRDTTSDGTQDTIANVTPFGGFATIGGTRTITWTNNGSFNRNVTIELSTDGGVTYPTVIASNVANTGTYDWLVPNLPTSQARVRVREYDFVAPMGASSADFTITLAPSAAGVSISGRVADLSGRGISGAYVTITDQNGVANYTRTNGFGYFKFDSVEAGQTYIVSVSHKRYRFQSRIVSANDQLTDVDFVPLF
jgi:hypothetical protein